LSCFILVRKLKVTLGVGAKSPYYASSGAAGLDLISSENEWIPSHGWKLIKTGIKIELPFGTYGRIAPRSGLALRSELCIAAGVIDNDFRGEIQILIFNHSSVDFKISKGDRIAKMISEKCYQVEVQVVNSLSETKRGNQGFGSTGKQV